MWAVLLTSATALALWARWWRSGLPWRDHVVLTGASLLARLHRTRVKGACPLPRSGPALILANHTCSADPAFLLGTSSRLIGFVVSREHYAMHPVIQRFLAFLGCVPVTRHGQDPVAARRALRRLDDGVALCLFPEGNLSGVARGRLHMPKAGIAFLALHRQVPVFPVYIAGGPRTHQLLRSWLSPRHPPVELRWGQEVDLSRFRGRPLSRRLLEEATSFLVEELIKLGRPRPRPAGCSSPKRGLTLS